MKLDSNELDKLILEALGMVDEEIMDEVIEEAPQSLGTKLKRQADKGVDSFEMDKLFNIFRIDEKTLGSEEQTYDRTIVEQYVKRMNLPTSDDPKEFVVQRLQSLTENSIATCSGRTAQSQVVSLGYLNSLKLVLNDYSSQGAGFIAESFLSTLFDASQVPAGEGGIEDIITKKKVGDKRLGISLKSFSSTSAKVEGSIPQLFQSLGIDFVMPGYKKAKLATNIRMTVAHKEYSAKWDGANRNFGYYENDKRRKVNLIYLIGEMEKEVDEAKSIVYNISPVITPDLVIKALQANKQIPNEMVQIGNELLPIACSFTKKEIAPTTTASNRGLTNGWLNQADKVPKVNTQMKQSTGDFMKGLGGTEKIKLPLKGEDLNNIAQKNLGNLWENLKKHENWYIKFVGDMAEYISSFDPDIRQKLNDNAKIFPNLPALVGDKGVCASPPAPVTEKIAENKQKTLDKLIEEVILEEYNGD